jgi:hypothetical protein
VGSSARIIFDIIPGLETIYKKRVLKEQGRKWLVASYTPEEFGVTNPDDIKWMNPRLSPMPWHTHDQPLRITNPKAKILPKSYICCTEFGNDQFKAQSPADWDYHELMKGHDVMITGPKELVRLLETLDGK